MKQELCVSIILPSYNEEAAMASVIKDVQETMTGSDYSYEVLVVDDGSSDQTAEIAAVSGARVVRHEKNRGVGRARKTGLREARGELIVMTDAGRIRAALSRSNWAWLPTQRGPA